MTDSKFIVLAEIPIKAEHLEEVKRLSAATLEQTLQEPGCEVFYQTVRTDDPTILIFFEVFRSKQDFERHQEASYTKRFFDGVRDKVAGAPVSRILQSL